MNYDELHPGVINYHLACNLFVKGVSQDSQFYWHYNPVENYRWVETEKGDKGISAFTFIELQEIIKNFIDKQ